MAEIPGWKYPPKSGAINGFLHNFWNIGGLCPWNTGDFDNPITDNVLCTTAHRSQVCFTQQTLTAELTLFQIRPLTELYVELKGNKIFAIITFICMTWKENPIGKKIVNMTKGFHEKINVSSLCPSGEYMDYRLQCNGFLKPCFCKIEVDLYLMQKHITSGCILLGVVYLIIQRWCQKIDLWRNGQKIRLYTIFLILHWRQPL